MFPVRRGAVLCSENAIISCTCENDPANINPASGDASASPGNLYRDLDLTIETLPIPAITGYSRNAHTHSAAQIEQIARSIEAFGFVIPLTIEADGTLIAGHGRLAAAKRLGRRTVPIAEKSPAETNGSDEGE